MLFNIPPNLPAVEQLKDECIFIQSGEPVICTDHPPLKIGILNLMPIKTSTETDFLRLLSYSPLPIEVDFLKVRSHQCKNTSAEHMDTFYKNVDEVLDVPYHGLVITGAPVELLDFREVTYWKELTQIFDWARKKIPSTLYICWAAQASLNHFYNIPKYPLQKKLFGIFKHTINEFEFPLFRGFDDEFFVPHSRHTEIRKDDILKVSELAILSESDKAGVNIVVSNEGKEIYITGHSEYAPETLDLEYARDIKRGLSISLPENYYKNDNPENGIEVKWRAHANLLFNNWLNHFCLPQKKHA